MRLNDRVAHKLRKSPRLSQSDLYLSRKTDFKNSCVFPESFLYWTSISFSFQGKLTARTMFKHFNYLQGFNKKLFRASLQMYTSQISIPQAVLAVVIRMRFSFTTQIWQFWHFCTKMTLRHLKRCSKKKKRKSPPVGFDTDYHSLEARCLVKSVMPSQSET